MFQRKSSSSLPTTTSSLNVPSGDTSGGGFGSSRPADGSGKAIRMDAPVVKAWKQSSPFTKYSYYILLACLFSIYMGYRYLRYWNASVWLTCHEQDCTLEVTPPGYRTFTVVFARTQLHSAQATKVDKAGNFLSVDDSTYVPPSRTYERGKKKVPYQGGAYKGPDENGAYTSYALKFYPATPAFVEKTEEDVDDGSFASVEQFLQKELIQEGEGEGEGEDAGHVEIWTLHMRKFGLTQSRTRVRSMVNKVESYLKRRRQKLLIKETAPLPWQGLLFLIFGLLGLMLTLLIGQFWDDPLPRKQGGPGARRSATSGTKKSRPTFVVDTGRPSKYPPGYNYHKKY